MRDELPRLYRDDFNSVAEPGPVVSRALGLDTDAGGHTGNLRFDTQDDPLACDEINWLSQAAAGFLQVAVPDPAPAQTNSPALLQSHTQ